MLHKSLKEEIEPKSIEERIMNSKEFKAKDLFDIMHVTKNR